MYVHRLELDKRPAGGGLITSESDSAVVSDIRRGSSVTLSYKEVRFVVQVFNVEPDQSFLGQVTTFDGWLEPNLEGLRIGSFIRFREQHIFACHQ